MIKKVQKVQIKSKQVEAHRLDFCLNRLRFLISTGHLSGSQPQLLEPVEKLIQNIQLIRNYCNIHYYRRC